MESTIPGPTRWDPVAFVRTVFDPARWLHDMVSTYGDMFHVNTVFGPVVVTGHPEAVRGMFTADPDTFEPFQPQSSAPFLGETSLVLVSGARHRRDRKLLSPPFNGARMRSYGAVMNATADRMIAAWTKGQSLRMLDQT